mgnify:CR=1 FL=1
MKYIFLTVCFMFFVTDNAFSQKSISHKVEKGETLTQIAKKYNVEISDIIKLNPLTLDHRIFDEYITMIADYYFIRKQQLHVDELYQHHGRYGYSNGFNTAAIIALLVGIVPNIPGFLLQIKFVSSTVFPVFISDLYHYAWFVGFFVSGIVYILLMRTPKR